MRIVIVCGGRGYRGRLTVIRAMDQLHAENPIDVLVHGACCDHEGILIGADRWAEEWAILRQVSYMGFPARWAALGRKAGPIRNSLMSGIVGVELVVAFPGGDGTASMVEAAEDKGIPVVTPIGGVHRRPTTPRMV